MWPDGFWDAICPGAFLPELWVTSYPAQHNTAAPHVQHPAQHSRSVGGKSSDSSSSSSSSSGSRHATGWHGSAELRDSPGEAAADSSGSRADARQAAAITVTAADVAAVRCTATAQHGSRASDGSGLSTCRAGGQAGTAVAGPSSSSSSSWSAAPGGMRVRDAPCRHAVTGFVCGPVAEAIAALPAAVAVRRALDQLDDMFGGALCSGLLVVNLPAKMLPKPMLLGQFVGFDMIGRQAPSCRQCGMVR